MTTEITYKGSYEAWKSEHRKKLTPEGARKLARDILRAVAAHKP